MTFNEKPKSTLQQRKSTTLTFIWLWVHWLVEHIPKYTRDQFTKLRQVTARHIRKEAEIILFSSKSSFKKKTKSTFEQTISAKNSQVWFWMQFLVEHAEKYVQSLHLEAGWLTEKYLREKEKEI